ncbi:Hsp20/alpha crystallin family protein [Halobacterium zhouii]|uniref:Hsp20/alpha crystallin family protein n=1 Tax=Halobacterium zhouii TaxID=2902624 RepID=UPI001E2B0A35|nr:Hsp20/alpha crystallin family protein [Halobacterium zhouii]
MNERDRPRSSRKSRETESPHARRQDHRASTDVQQGGTGGSFGARGQPQPPEFGGVQPAPPESEGEKMTQQSTQGQQQSRFASPMVDVVETPKELVVYADTPGFEKDDIQIHADANTLSVSADRSSKPPFDEDEGERGLVIERPSKLERTITLPVHVDPEEASASYEDGVCEITIPKEEGDKRREVAFQ